MKASIIFEKETSWKKVEAKIQKETEEVVICGKTSICLILRRYTLAMQFQIT